MSNINITTVKLHHGNNEVSASWGNVQGDIYMVKFSRSLVQSMLNSLIGDVELKVTGKVNEETFEGTDTIRVK